MKFINYLFHILVISTPLLEARPKSKSFEWPSCNYQETKNNIKVNANILTQDETRSLFNGYGKNFINQKNSIIPFKFQISNNSNDVVSLNENDINLPIFNAESSISNSGNLGKKILYGTAGALIGIMIAPALTVACVLPFVPYFSYGIWGIYGYLTGSAAVVCASVGGTIGSMQDKEQPIIKNDSKIETLSREVVEIKPKEIKEFLCFVYAKKLKQPLVMNLNTQGNNKISFSI